ASRGPACRGRRTAAPSPASPRRPAAAPAGWSPSPPRYGVRRWPWRARDRSSCRRTGLAGPAEARADDFQRHPPPRFALFLGKGQDLGAGLVLDDAQPARDFGVGVGNAAKVAAEAVLVELLAGGHVPEPAAIRTDLVGQHGAHHLAF